MFFILKHPFRLLLFASLTLAPASLIAQYSLKTQDSLVRVLVNRHIAISQAKQSMPGYRIQIYFGPQRDLANEVKSDFTRLYPGVGAYLVYQQPNFKIRVGDFKTRLDAMKFLKEIQPVYSTAFLVMDEVRLPRE
jgi:hypothetical protein